MIKIPDQYYVGVRSAKSKDKEIPLGFATPYAKDSAFLKRKATVDKWVGGGSNARHETFDNVLLEGFRISQSVRRYGWNGGNVVWRIVASRTYGDGIVVLFGNRGTYIYDSTATGNDPTSKTLNNGWVAPTGLKYVVKAK